MTSMRLALKFAFDTPAQSVDYGVLCGHLKRDPLGLIPVYLPPVFIALDVEVVGTRRDKQGRNTEKMSEVALIVLDPEEVENLPVKRPDEHCMYDVLHCSELR
jgi:hypothetical protein